MGVQLGGGGGEGGGEDVGRGISKCSGKRVSLSGVQKYVSSPVLKTSDFIDNASHFYQQLYSLLYV